MKKCPRCHKMTLENEQVMNSQSRRNRKIYICNGCGNDEGFIDAGVMPADKMERDFVAKVRK